jgi:hypothetical protein
MPVSPACCDRSQSRIDSASLSACADTSTRKAMLAPRLGKKFGGGASASGSYIFVAFADAFDSLVEVLMFPVQICGQRFIERGCRILAVSLRIFFELRPAFRFKRNRIHTS